MIPNPANYTQITHGQGLTGTLYSNGRAENSEVMWDVWTPQSRMGTKPREKRGIFLGSWSFPTQFPGISRQFQNLLGFIFLQHSKAIPSSLLHVLNSLQGVSLLFCHEQGFYGFFGFVLSRCPVGKLLIRTASSSSSKAIQLFGSVLGTKTLMPALYR